MLIFIATAVVLFILGLIFYHAECVKRGDCKEYLDRDTDFEEEDYNDITHSGWPADFFFPDD